ncbi:hydroxyacylglutathione hydrolase [Polaromonas sp. CG_9.7]|uniref:hydroxyacylglutathione hydrolase C-terminal domain-containing protein n=1 Tax=Polaromonas sp. CG_23.6 TaxID=2760709 RepID=UPI0018CA6567|nr:MULTISPECIES: hydroxyacylglutathione hydrolase C-terminal domain-containing protein [unclassified Polaromonas]MBG6072657.1 hydroxyacylglutathione hydrolase [Polaromonas sp. CG_9.7]MBG6114624.1 hydroxyacylglutathione hydrolase [Polaromonas sp. CG_9.2]MDH6185213.1 hydroxyacylglutathione hydrolase [Polaromonas sp. CG_23.6]
MKSIAASCANRASLPCTIRLEVLINTFLRTRETDTMTAVHHLDASTHDDSTVFSALRQWKNQFK